MRHRHRNGATTLGALALVAAMVAPTAAQEPTIEVLAEGLNIPRGIDIAPDGSLYVVEAGVGGDLCPDGEAGACFGSTGAILRISEGVIERVIEGLPSSANGPEVGGISDIAMIDDESFYLVSNLGADPTTRAGRDELALSGWLLRGSTDGSTEAVADVAAFETTDNPDAEFSGAALDSNPYSIAISEGGVAVADAGANAVVLVDDEGVVSLVSVFPPRMHEFPAELLAAMGPPPGSEDGAPPAGEEPPDGEAPAEGGPPEMIPIPVESVPTTVVVGPDGALYVGELTGAPFPVGGASILRVVAGEEPTEYATGFTNIIDIGFGPDGTLYVAEIVHDGLMGVFAGDAPPVGAVLSVPPGGGEPSIVAIGEQLMAPGGLAVGDDGSVYVSTGTLMPGAGAVIKITP